MRPRFYLYVQSILSKTVLGSTALFLSLKLPLLPPSISILLAPRLWRYQLYTSANVYLSRCSPQNPYSLQSSLLRSLSKPYQNHLNCASVIYLKQLSSSILSVEMKITEIRHPMRSLGAQILAVPHGSSLTMIHLLLYARRRKRGPGS